MTIVQESQSSSSHKPSTTSPKAVDALKIRIRDGLRCALVWHLDYNDA